MEGCGHVPAEFRVQIQDKATLAGRTEIAGEHLEYAAGGGTPCRGMTSESNIN